MFYLAMTSSADAPFEADLYRGDTYLITIESDELEENQSANMATTECVQGEQTYTFVTLSLGDLSENLCHSTKYFFDQLNKASICL